MQSLTEAFSETVRAWMEDELGGDRNSLHFKLFEASLERLDWLQIASHIFGENSPLPDTVVEIVSFSYKILKQYPLEDED